MNESQTRERTFDDNDVVNLIASVHKTLSNLYEVLEMCSTDRESKKIAGSIYMLETGLYGKSQMNPFTDV